MALKKLTKDIFCKLSEKQICIYEKSVSYLEELCSQYDILKSITYIVDTNERSQGKFVFQNKVLEVYGQSQLQAINFNQTVIIITSDYYKEAYAKIMAALAAENLDMEIYYFANRETEYEEVYRVRYCCESLKNMIIFRSGPHASAYVKGMDFEDNARALFEYALQTGLNHQYELVWFVKNPKEFEKYGDVENVCFLSFDWSVSEKQEERDAYYSALCLAKYIFFTDAYGFARNCRSDQIRIQLWHGCGFKTRVNFVRCEGRYEYTTVISDLYADIHADIYGLRKDQILVTGYAKQDWLFHPDEDDIKKLCIPDAGKYIFWLPTFRSTEHKLEQLNEYCLQSETGLPVVNTREKLNDLNTILAENNIVLIVKLHPFQDRSIVHCENYANIHLVENEDLVRCGIPINRLLGHADALISDYSSAAVDFMLLDKPIAFLLEDVDEYGKSRGFVFENIREWLPGKEVNSFEEICVFVGEIAGNYDITAVKRRELRDKMHKYCDDKNCQRILGALGISGQMKPEVLACIADIFHVSVEEIVNITVLKKGMTNHSFLFSSKGRKYIMRIPGEGTEQLINRRQEAQVYKVIENRGLCDNVIYLNPRNGFKITKFLDGVRVCDADNISDLEKCMQKLRNFHKMHLVVEHEFDLFGQIDLYESLWDGKVSVYKDYYSTKQNVFLLRKYIEEHASICCLTHIDAIPDNFLFYTNDEGEEELQLTDWEYAGMQDPHVDIAMFCIYSFYDKFQVDRLIDIYFEYHCQAEVRIKIYCYIAVCGLLWSNWCEYKKSLGVEFGDYSLRQYRYAREYYDIAMQEMEADCE